MLLPRSRFSTTKRGTPTFLLHLLLHNSCLCCCGSFDTKNVTNSLLYLIYRLEELQGEFDEYQQSSRELENELETQLSNYEKRNLELEVKNRNLVTENEVLRTRFERISSESHNQLNDLQSKYEKVSTENEQLKSYIRDLEQSNDDLDRAKRTLDATLAEFDSRLNEQIERNELLESEIGEKEQLQVVIQRLKDEARDLRLELMIQQGSKNKKAVVGDGECNNSTGGTTPSGPHHRQSKAAVHSNNNNSFSERLTNGSGGGGPTTPESNKTFAGGSPNGSPNYSTNTPKQSPNPIPLLSASSRISALNIVSDLLRKVGALESKLASCRSIVPVSATLMNSKMTSPVKGSGSSTTGANNNNVDTNSPVNSSSFKDINTSV